jgi:hypothetical protein
MDPIKAVVYGVGGINRAIARYMQAKGVRIVGAIDVDPALVGRDLAEVIGLEAPLNVLIDADADRVLTLSGAQIAVVSVFSRIERMFPLIATCVEHGLNVITPAEEALYPWGVAPALAEKLDALAKRHAVTVAGGGAQDSFRVNMPALLSGASQRIDSVLLRQMGNLARLGNESIRNYHIGVSEAEFRRLVSATAQAPLFSLQICIEALIADLGMTIQDSRIAIEPLIAEADTPVRALSSGIVAKGDVVGMFKAISVRTREGIPFKGEQISRVAALGPDDPTNISECIIEGLPRLCMRIEGRDQEANASAAASIVNRLPDVIAAEPGYVTIDRLRKLKFRAGPRWDPTVTRVLRTDDPSGILKEKR